MAYPFNTYNQYFPQYNQMQQQIPQQIQNGGFVSVPNIEVARSYHVAPGTSVTFIDENAPYVYTKTRGFSQFEQPVFEKLRLVKEEDAAQSTQDGQEAVSDEQTIKYTDYATKAEIKAIRKELDALQADITALKGSEVDDE